MQKRDAAMLAAGMMTIGGHFYALHTDRTWKFYLLLAFVLVPAAAQIGYSLGQETTKLIDEDVESEI